MVSSCQVSQLFCLHFTTRVRFPAETVIFLFTIASKLALELTQPPIQWIIAIKGPKHQTDYSPSYTTLYPAFSHVGRAHIQIGHCMFFPPKASICVTSGLLTEWFGRSVEWLVPFLTTYLRQRFEVCTKTGVSLADLLFFLLHARYIYVTRDRQLYFHHMKQAGLYTMNRNT
jgi:hypothetical protein